MRFFWLCRASGTWVDRAHVCEQGLTSVSRAPRVMSPRVALLTQEVMFDPSKHAMTKVSKESKLNFTFHVQVTMGDSMAVRACVRERACVRQGGWGAVGPEAV